MRELMEQGNEREKLRAMLKVPSYILFSLVSLTVISCKNQSPPDIFSSTLESTLSEVYSNSLDGVTFHVEGMFLDSAFFYSSLEELIGMDKYKSVQEDLTYLSNHIKSPARLDFIDDSNTKFPFKLSTVFNESQAYGGVIVLSEPAFVSADLAYYYLGLYCQENCYRDTFRNVGNLIKVRLIDGNWRFEETVLMWGG
jgi:hypothetical protein